MRQINHIKYLAKVNKDIKTHMFNYNKKLSLNKFDYLFKI